MRCYYIYALCDPDGEIFYVGLSKVTPRYKEGTRPKRHLLEAAKYSSGIHSKRANLHKLRRITKIVADGKEVEIRILTRQLTKDEAMVEETRVISSIGRRDLGTGPLTNMTSGGEGARELSEETRRKISESKKGRPSPLKGSKVGPYTPDRVAKTTEAVRASLANKPGWRKGISEPMSDETKRKISESLKGRPSPLKGRSSPFKGVKRGPMTDEQKHRMKGRPAHNKGKPSPNQGRSYEDIYGEDKAAELKEKRRQQKLTYWASKDISPDD